MPELPEIETIRRDLDAVLRGRTVSSVEVRDKRLLVRVRLEDLQRVFCGARWDRVDRRGKYLVVTLSNNWRVIFHLRMTGQLVLGDSNEAPSSFRMVLTFDDRRRLYFLDQRRFGEVFLISPGVEWPVPGTMGPEPLNGWTPREFSQSLKRRTTRIKPLLMDQRFVAGIGNIYAQEALFRAGIRPSRPARGITSQEATRLFDCLRETLTRAIAHRGSTSRNYRDAFGREGSAQTLHAVYRKGGKPCPRCGTALRESRVGGRGTVYCSLCQR